VLQVGGSNTTTTGASDKQPKPGGMLTIGTSQIALSFDPKTYGGTNQVTVGTFAYSVFDVLAWTDNTTYEVHGQIADAISSTDGVNWTLHLRPGVKFSDGTAYDAAAVKTAWERFQDPKTASAGADAVADIASMTVTDPQTLKVVLKGVNGQWPRTVAGRIAWIPSPSAVSAKGDSFTNSPVGAGPFLVKEFQQSSKLVLVRNPTYWNAPRPYLDGITFLQISDETQRDNTFKAGGFDMNLTLSDVVGSPGNNKGYNVLTSILNGGWGLELNNTKPPFDDVKIRQAMAIAFDKQRFNQVTADGNRLLIDQLETPGGPTYDSTISIPGYNRDAAQAAFDDYAARTGGPLTFTLSIANTSTSIIDAAEMQGQLLTYKNVKVSVETLNTSVYVANQISGSYQAAWNALRWQDATPAVYSALLCANVGTTNYTRFCNTEVDKALTTLKTSLDPNARTEATKQVERILVTQDPYVFFARYRWFLISVPRLQGLRVYFDQIIFTDGLWLDR
jgi:peptide/nickel transport system substrate-binding protein